MNVTNYSSSSSNASTFICFRQLPDDEYLVGDYFFSVLAIVLNLLTCPLTVLLNALIITAVKTKRRLQTNYNIVLASLAGTDLAVGIAAQPAFIAEQIYRLTGGSPYVFCKIHSIIQVATIFLCLGSLFHLAIISVERYVALKFSLRYESIVNKFRLTVAVAVSWLIVMVYGVTKFVPAIPVFPVHILVSVSLLVILYCHISVYFVCRRHMIQIKSEQVSQEATAKFLKEKKAWKTTGIIIGGVISCYLPGLLGALAFRVYTGPNRAVIFWILPVTFSFYMLNSLCNPIIYCWRSKEIREALKQLLRKQSN